MARDLTKSDKNTVRIFDGLSDSEIVLFYRTPTSEDLFGYQTNIVRREGKKFRPRPETRLKYALRIITGIREGDFTIEGKPLSSEEGNGSYREDWKELLGEFAPDILDVFARRIFEGTRAADAEEVELEMGGEDVAPLGER